MSTPPYIISWNVTRRCNLACTHCYIDACSEAGSDTLSTEAALAVIGDIAANAPGAMLVLSGGEPLLRGDIDELIREASGSGLTVVLGTNATLVDLERARELKEAGLAGAGISIDAPLAEAHDRIRGVAGSFEKTLAGIATLKEAGIDFQTQFTVRRSTLGDLSAMVALSRRLGATALNVFFLVCTGRGEELTDITPEEYEQVLTEVVVADLEEGPGFMVRARCAPHVVRIAEQSAPGGEIAAGRTSGCIAARGYLRIDPDGLVTPCPYMKPNSSSPDIREEGLATIWQEDALFTKMRGRDYEGKCSECRYKDACGGCRARALELEGEVMDSDPWCLYEPKPDEKDHSAEVAGEGAPIWSDEALKRLEKIPAFVREMVKRSAERHAKKRGIVEITPALLKELKPAGAAGLKRPGGDQ